jgi:tetratricopeptide (TPR) repeat protein
MFRVILSSIPPALRLALAGAILFIFCSSSARPQAPSRTLEDYFSQAKQMENAQDYAGAAKVYQEAAANFPQQPEILKRLGIVYQTQLKFTESISTFQKVLADAPQYPEVNFYQGLSYFGLNQFDKAIEAFERELAANPQYRRAHYYEAQAYLQLHQNSDALRQYEILLKQDPTDKRVIYQVIRFHKARTIDAINQMGTLDADSDYMHALKAENFFDQGSLPEAIKEYNAVLERNPDFPGVHLALGNLHHRTLDISNAERELRLALREDPNHPMANFLLADILLKSNRVNDAVPLLEISIAADPQSMLAHFELGKCYASQGKLQEALKELNRAAEIDPSYRSTHYLLADVYKRLNQPEKENAHRAIFRKLYDEDREKQSKVRTKRLEEAVAAEQK